MGDKFASVGARTQERKRVQEGLRLEAAGLGRTRGWKK